jgi:hypothetical protein
VTGVSLSLFTFIVNSLFTFFVNATRLEVEFLAIFASAQWPMREKLSKVVLPIQSPTDSKLLPLFCIQPSLSLLQTLDQSNRSFPVGFAVSQRIGLSTLFHRVLLALGSCG